MNTREIDKHRTWVAKEQNSAILYRDYQYLKMLVHVKGGIYTNYKRQIELDLPRSFPHSKWLKNPATLKLIKRQLKIWCVYSPIGYYQGMLFLLVPLCYRYQGLDHISFFAFVALVKRLHFVNKDVVNYNVARKEKEEVLHVMRVLSHCCPEVRKYDQNTLQRMALKIEYGIMFTLGLNRCGLTLQNTDLILNYFLKVLYDKKDFIARLKSFSLAFLLCLMKGKISIEELSVLELNREALQAIIHCAESCGTLFKAFA
ncbi:MAG: hypothetical protein CMH46_00125 [Muricauda sp.]|nr:hypothetical protein [Allomuricauda sp.]MAU13928.1 hypothetical protein [Allomuricauda sp.]